jgi:hypothetical protein
VKTYCRSDHRVALKNSINEWFNSQLADVDISQ